MELIKIIMGLITYRINEIKSKLEVEGKANDIASMQGELKGLKMYESSMIEFLTLFDMWQPIASLKISDVKNSVLKLLVNQVNESRNDERWQSIENMVDSEIESMKNYLLFTAENARSLHLTHGKKEGLFLSRDLMKKIISEYDWRVEREKERKEDEPLLEWMKDHEQEEGVVDAVEAFEDLFIDDTEEVLN